MKTLFLLLFALNSVCAFAGELHDGEVITANVVDCKAGYYGVLSYDSRDYADSKNVKGTVVEFAKKVTARCIPKVCEIRYWLPIFGGQAATITLIAGQGTDFKIGDFASSSSAENALVQYVKDGICAKTRTHVNSM